MALKDRTAAELTGIKVEGDKWLTIIENARDSQGNKMKEADRS